MKTFLNVLYRRILYKIPLKLLLVLLAVFGILFACFSNAMDLPTATRRETGNYVYNGLFDYIADKIEFGTTPTEVIIADDIDFVCFKGYRTDTSASYNLEYSINGGTWYNVWGNEIGCTDQKTLYFRGGPVLFSYFIEGDGYVPEQYDSLQCQTEYSLIPISSVDSNYCTTNNLCPSCPVCPSVPVGTGGYSQLYINNILHLGAPNIIMNIPDEIDWDYAYTNSGQNMNIDVVGYNVDYEKIDSIVQFQNYKPSSEDFQKIIGLLAPYTKIIVFFVFLFIVWAWIKKPFKSKKL